MKSVLYAVVPALLAGRAAAGTITVNNGTANATSTSSVTSTPTEPCALASSLWAAVSASATPTIPAAVAHACLSSVPLNKENAIVMIDSIEPYLAWQSDVNYKADPPADYFYDAYDIYDALAAVRSNVENEQYASEYEFQSDLYVSVFGQGHDGHLVYYPDLLTGVFAFARPLSLVSITEDGTSLPVVKVYEDVVSSPETASAVTEINGIDAATYIEDLIFTATFNQDPDAAYNSMFFSMAANGAELGSGYFSSGGRIRYIYQGANTTLSFANGTEATFENVAQVKSSLDGITDGASMYTRFCYISTDNEAAATASAKDVVEGYPEPVNMTGDGIVSCYYLDEAGYEDVVVLALLAFENEWPSEFQAVLSKCISDSLVAGKTKLVVDLSANGGGYVLQGYDFFRQLFPQIVQDGYSRWRESDGLLAIAQIDTALAAGLDPLTSDNETALDAYGNFFNYRYDLDVDNKPFESFEAKFAPHVYKDTNYTAIMRWNLDDQLTTVNSSWGMGMEISGYGTLANLTQPFAAEDIILVYDGYCASTCTLASEMLRIQAGVRSVAFGGRPQEGTIQGVGGIKGAQTLGFTDVYGYANNALEYAQNDEQRAALKQFTVSALERSTAAALNTRDQILRGNLEDGLPAQYVVEESDCRLYWTADMITDITAVWKAAADVAFNGATCNAGSIPQTKKRSPPSRIERQRRAAAAKHVSRGVINFETFERRREQDRTSFDALFNQKVIV